MSDMFYFFFLQNAENNRFKKSQLAKFCNVIFWLLLKVRSIGPVDQQINFVLPEVFPLRSLLYQHHSQEYFF